LTAALDRSFASLRIPNYRRYFSGQLVSISGNWMQTVAEIWVVLSLTGSGVAVGFTTALQFLPMLLVGAWGGLIADRLAKRPLLIATQALHMLPPLVLFALAVANGLSPVAVYAVALARGVVNAVDYPTRQAFVVEMVGSGKVVNAVSLNSVLIHAARVVGPALAGILIATVGVEPCFALNAASYGVMIVALAGMEPDALRPAAIEPRRPGGVRAGLRYVRATPQLWIPLGLMAVVGTFGFNFQSILPLLARFTFDGGASSYAALVTAMGIGAVVGALATGARNTVTPALLAGAAIGFGALALLAAGAPSLGFELLLLAPLGAASVTLAASVNSALQLASEPAMRGRVMALYSIVFLGSTPIGAPLAGWISELVDPRAALVMAGVAALVAGMLARVAFERASLAPRASSSRFA
jgi:MFS family permease